MNQCVKERDSLPLLNGCINPLIITLVQRGGNSTRSGQSSNSRKASIFQGQLVQSVTGPMDPGHNKGIQNRICNSTHSGKTAQSRHVINLRTNVTGGGDSKVANQGGSHRGSPRKEASGFLLQPLPRTQERWGHETGNQSEGSKHLHSPPRFQDGGPSHIEGPPEGGGLDDKGRSEGCILHDTNPTARQAVPKFLLRKPKLPVHMPAIRPVLCSLGLYQDPEAGTNSAQRSGSEASGIHRRHSSPGGDSGEGEDSHRGPNLSPREPGIHSTSRENHIATIPGNRVPGDGGRLEGKGTAPTGSENKETKAGGQPWLSDTIGLRPLLGKCHAYWASSTLCPKQYLQAHCSAEQFRGT